MTQRSALSLALPAGAAANRSPDVGGHLPRRGFLRAAVPLGLAGAALPLLAGCGPAAPRRTPAAAKARIGVISTGPGPEMPEFEALRRGLRELGYVEGQNLTFEYRFAPGNTDVLPQFAAELVALRPDVVVGHGLPACRAMKDATNTIPIVFCTGGDPVAVGFAASLARPGGNITGLVHNPAGLDAKRLQLLKQAVPGVSRVAVLMRPGNTTHALEWSEAQAAASALGVQVQPVEVPGPDQLAAALAATAGEGLDGFLAFPDAVFLERRTQITDFASGARLPAIFQEREYAQAGGLISYGANILANFHRGATYVDKIVKGANPAEMPIEQPARFDFVVNRKTATAIGLAVSPAVLEQVTEAIA